MVQLSHRKKIIILISAIVIVIALIAVLVIDKKKNPGQSVIDNQISSTSVREMTRQEKIKVHIDPGQAAEVVNDQNGLYIYRLNK